MQESQDSLGLDLSLRVWIAAPLPFFCSHSACTIQAEHTSSEGRGQPLLATTEWKRSLHQLGFPERALAVDCDCVCDSILGELNLISVTLYHFRWLSLRILSGNTGGAIYLPHDALEHNTSPSDFVIVSFVLL